MRRRADDKGPRQRDRPTRLEVHGHARPQPRPDPKLKVARTGKGALGRSDVKGEPADSQGSSQHDLGDGEDLARAPSGPSHSARDERADDSGQCPDEIEQPMARLAEPDSGPVGAGGAERVSDGPEDGSDRSRGTERRGRRRRGVALTVRGDMTRASTTPAPRTVFRRTTLSPARLVTALPQMKTAAATENTIPIELSEAPDSCNSSGPRSVTRAEEAPAMTTAIAAPRILRSGAAVRMLEMTPRCFDEQAPSRPSEVSITVTIVTRTAATTNGAARPKYWAMKPAKAGPAMEPNPDAVMVPVREDSSPEALASHVRAAVHTMP